MRKYTSVDFFKFISSLFIVGIHILTSPFSPNMSMREHFTTFQIFQVLGRYAVPFFFITSSFLFFRKYLIQENKEKRNRYKNKAIARILKLYLFWFIVLLPVTFLNKFYHGQHSSYLIDLIFFIKGLVLGETFGASWYLSSSIFCIIAVTFLLNRNMSLKRVLAVTFVFQILCSVTSVYGNITLRYLPLERIYTLIEYPSLSIIAGLFYFSLGLIIAKYENQIYTKLSMYYAILLTIIGFVLVFIEINMAMINNWVYTTDQSFSLAVAASGIVLICIKLDIKCSEKISNFLRSASTVTYMSHLGLYTIYIFLNRYILHIGALDNKITMYFLVIVTSWVLTYAIIKCIKINNDKISRILKISL